MPRGRKARGRAAPAPAPPPSDPSSDEGDDDAPPAPRADDADGAEDRASDGAEEDGAEDDPDASVLRILISTDNHLGYLERDPIRGRDSFAALEEVLALARQRRADLVLLAGDLFHESKPSRQTLHATMGILRRYCMGSDPVSFQIVSDQGACLRSLVTGRANYEDEYSSIDLPIFTIHGNHDEPTRDGGPDLLSAVDLLATANLVNYFGRQDDVAKVEVSPVLLQKGTTKVALYGMGAMRDERLNRMWQGKKVKFLRPDADHRRDAEGRRGNGDEDEDDGDSPWFNIFALHQNKADSGRGNKNCVHESMIPEWMDLVVWGHEHECLIEPQESLVGTFRITQPGSSVATALTAGEAKRKQVGLCEVRGCQFRLTSIPLSSVRSFVTDEVSLQEKATEAGLDLEDPRLEEQLSDVLAAEVDGLIQRAREEAAQLRQDAEDAARSARALEDEFDPDGGTARERQYHVKDPDRVLVRLKVEHTGFATQFVGQVANPSDILLFQKRRQADSAKGGRAAGKGGKRKRAGAGLDVPVEPEDLADINIEDLVADNLINNEKKLQLLDEKSMGEALELFVDKKNAQAIRETANDILQHNQKILIRRGTREGDDDKPAVDNPTSVHEFLGARADKHRADFEIEREDTREEKEGGETTKEPKKRREKGPSSGAAAARRRANSNDDDMALGDSEEENRPNKKKPRTATTAAKKRATAAKPRKDYEYSEEDDESDDVEDPPPSKRRATAKKAPARKAPATKAPPSRRAAAADESDSDIEFVGSLQATSRTAARARPARAGRAAATKKAPATKA